MHKTASTKTIAVQWVRVTSLGTRLHKRLETLTTMILW